MHLHIGGASNKCDSQIKRRRRLPLELQCEVFSLLPFQHGRRMLLLSRPIATNCIALVRKQKQKFGKRWDPTACHKNLTLIEPKRLVVKNNGKNNWGKNYSGGALCSLNGQFQKRISSFFTTKFGEGDVIGCGVNLATRQIIYTKNGQRLETAGLCVDFGADLSPCITLFNPGTKIEANFGPNFKFNIAADGN